MTDYSIDLYETLILMEKLSKKTTKTFAEILSLKAFYWIWGLDMLGGKVVSYLAWKLRTSIRLRRKK